MACLYSEPRKSSSGVNCLLQVAQSNLNVKKGEQLRRVREYCIKYRSQQDVLRAVQVRHRH